MECIMKAREIYRQTTLNGKNKSSAEQAVDRVIGKYTLQQIYDFFDMQHKFMNRKRQRGGGGSGSGDCIVWTAQLRIISNCKYNLKIMK